MNGKTKGDDSLRLLVSAFEYRPTVGGVATVGYELARALDRSAGCSVKVLAPFRDGAEGFDARSGVATARAAVPSSTLAAIAPLARAHAAQARAWRPHATLGLLWLPDGCAAYAASVRARLPLAGPRVPYFVFAHGVEVLESARSLRKRARAALSPLKRRVFREAAGVFCVSDFTAGLVERLCEARPERIHCAYNGVDPAAFFPAPRAADLERAHGLEGRRVFLTVSRLCEYKGIDRAIASFREAARGHPDARYLICGEGPDRGRLEALARHYRVSDKVVFAGQVPASRLRDYYNLCDAFVLLSREEPETPDVEGFGLVYLEAAACGKPSIAGRSGGVPSAVAPDCGWLVDPTDDRAIAAAMADALASPGAAAARGERARARALAGFTWDRVAERVLDAVRGSLGVRD